MGIGMAPELLRLFPPSTRVDAEGRLRVGGCDLRDLAHRFGTPAYVFDEAALERRAAEYLEALRARWPDSSVVFATKASPFPAVCRRVTRPGLGCDVASRGELALALAAGVDPARIVVHGNAKDDAFLDAALRHRVRYVVVDSLADVERLEARDPARQAVLVRVIPDVDAPTHEATATGHATSKFGLAPDAAREAIARLRRLPGVSVDGLHVHIGSQILATRPFADAVAAVAHLGPFPVYDLGGGLGVPYARDEHAPTVDAYAETLVAAVRRHLPWARTLLVEPGRSLVARAGLTLYRVVSVKHGARTHVAVDGGMGDNLEPMLYGTRFEAAVVGRCGDEQVVDLVGHHCESGDRLVAGARLARPRAGDLVAVPVTGAYCASLANNYNGAPRPPAVFCRDGRAQVVVRRETVEDLLARDCDPAR